MERHEIMPVAPRIGYNANFEIKIDQKLLDQLHKTFSTILSEGQILRHTVYISFFELILIIKIFLLPENFSVSSKLCDQHPNLHSKTHYFLLKNIPI